ncbi:MAG: hypothetical protein AAGA12_09550 [Pseudomonadota bacterium]
MTLATERMFAPAVQAFIDAGWNAPANMRHADLADMSDVLEDDVVFLLL